MTWTRSIFAGLMMALTLGACSDSSSPMDPGADDGGTPNQEVEATFGIVLQPAPDAAASPVQVDGGPARAAISLDKVESITLDIERVDALRADAEPDEDGWIEAGTVNDAIDLLALPDEGLELVDSSLPAGSYLKLRFILAADPTITLSEDLRVGGSTWEAGEHPLVIPGSEQNGVRLRADFEVDAEGEILTIEFDADATVRRVTATGSGVLKISPELQVRDEQGAPVGELEEEDEDDDAESDDDGNELEAEGPVTGIDVANGTFTMEHEGEEITVTVADDTEIDGDLMTLEAVAGALDDGETVTAEAEGTVQDDGSLLAAEVEFESDGEDEADDDEEAEVEGLVTAIDPDAGTVDIEQDGEVVTVVVDDATTVELDGDLETLADAAAALDEGATLVAEAEGVIQDDGSLLASKLEIEAEDDEDEDDEDEEEEDEEEEEEEEEAEGGSGA